MIWGLRMLIGGLDGRKRMELDSIGKDFYPGYRFAVRYLPADEAMRVGGGLERFWVFGVSKDAVVPIINGYPLPLVAPALVCLSERDSIVWERDSTGGYHVVLARHFHFSALCGTRRA